jgi:hypothetical protein
MVQLAKYFGAEVTGYAILKFGIGESSGSRSVVITPGFAKAANL